MEKVDEDGGGAGGGGAGEAALVEIEIGGEVMRESLVSSWWMGLLLERAALVFVDDIVDESRGNKAELSLSKPAVEWSGRSLRSSLSERGSTCRSKPDSTSSPSCSAWHANTHAISNSISSSRSAPTLSNASNSARTSDII
mmetsp:Transcript_8218/g.17712  ORF Transcript_8218/g.17712 Transcript_8218/m.17712 type:complete len:141 (+) Transcript_8218:499-921(+)